MNPGRFSMPSMRMGAAPFIGANYMAPRSIGLFGRIGSSLKAFNWRGLLNGANKTLNVVNQTIPLIRQAKPMFSNMRSMMQLAKAFGNETASGRGRGRNRRINNNLNSNVTINRNSNNNVVTDSSNTENSYSSNNSNYPNFFI